MDAMKHVTRFALIVLFFAGLFFVPSYVYESQTYTLETSLNENNLTTHEPAEVLGEPAKVRVALYNETNTTRPSYDSTNSYLIKNYTSIFGLLTDAGYEVTRITLQDILNHKLITASYDVLVLADNLPRENITKHVKDFWLGGGGILSIDSAAAFLNYMGMVPEAEGDDGYNTYWTYRVNKISNVTIRHPTTKSYSLGEQIVGTNSDYGAFIWSALQTSAYSDDFIKLAIDDDDSDYVYAIGYDSFNRGGKVVHAGIWPTPINANWTSFIEDAVQWLKPKPKARIAFDYSHHPHYGVDIGDPSRYSTYVDSAKYSMLRDTLVNKSYTFDKFYLSPDGNFTSDRLAPYDILIVNTPEWNFTASEVEAVQSWVEDGGGLWAMGDQTPSFIPDNQNLNYLLNECDMKLNNSQKYDNYHTITSDLPFHPLREEISKIHFAGGVYINITGSAEAIAYNESNIHAAVREWGEGRIVLIGDINWPDADRLVKEDNYRFAVNIANWLSAATAKVLVYHDWYSLDDTLDNYNEYKSAITNALNELELDFMFTNTTTYFNLSLGLQEWDLVICDVNNYGLSQSTHSLLIDHLDGGGKLIMRSWKFYSTGYPLWNYLGFEGAGSTITLGPPTVYLWDSDHPIFNNPFDYQADNITTSQHFLNTDYANVTLFDNATALAGLTESPTENQSAIVLGVEGRAICNQFSTLQYFDDTDDSTYPDNFELLLNEIVYLMRPTIDSPPDFSKEAGSPGDSITWTPSSPWPLWVEVHAHPVGVYDHLLIDEVWDGGPITVATDIWAHLQPTDVLYTIIVWDNFGQYVLDEVAVLFDDTTSPALVEAPSNLAYNESTTVHLLNWTFEELYPHFYLVYVNGTMEYNGTWDGSELSVDIGGLDKGVWNVTIFVNDTTGNSAIDTVFLTVTDNTSPVITAEPTNLEYAEGVSSHTLTWEISEQHPASFILYVDGVIEESGAWDSSELSFNLGGLSEGTYNVTLVVTDESGLTAISMVTLTVTEAPTTTTTTTTTTDGTLPFGLDTTTLIIIAAAGVVLVIIIIVVIKRKK